MPFGRPVFFFKKKCEQSKPYQPRIGERRHPISTGHTCVSKEMKNDDISYEQGINESNPAEQMSKYAVALQELRHQPIEIVIERLFVQGEFNMLT